MVLPRNSIIMNLSDPHTRHLLEYIDPKHWYLHLPHTHKEPSIPFDVYWFKNESSLIITDLLNEQHAQLVHRLIAALNGTLEHKTPYQSIEKTSQGLCLSQKFHQQHAKNHETYQTISLNNMTLHLGPDIKCLNEVEHKKKLWAYLKKNWTT